jgi:hypothetical protein
MTNLKKDPAFQKAAGVLNEIKRAVNSGYFTEARLAEKYLISYIIDTIPEIIEKKFLILRLCKLVKEAQAIDFPRQN